MYRTALALGCFGLLLLTGCSKKAAPLPSQSVALSRVAQASPEGDSARRFIAIQHKLVIEASEAQLQKAWESLSEFCRTIGCEITASGFTGATPDSPSSGTLSMRVVPQDLKKLLDLLGKSGSIVQHVTESEDKTATVIDVESETKNLTGYRDSLRTMLAKPSASFKDVMEVQRELTKVQSELDSLATKRKLLAAETEKVAVEITFRASRSYAGPGLFAPIASALRQSGTTLSESIAALITVAAALIPWALVMVPVFWVSRKMLRRLRRKRSTSA